MSMESAIYKLKIFSMKVYFALHRSNESLLKKFKSNVSFLLQVPVNLSLLKWNEIKIKFCDSKIDQIWKKVNWMYF